jgi:hypothetical protein
MVAASSASRASASAQWLAGAALLLLVQACSAAPACRAETRGPAPHVIELYTSEGCDSCPPLDKWLGEFKGKTGVLPLAFHVDYFDHQGWKDRFASPAHTRRQKELLSSSGARFIYTPQVLIDGRERKDAAAALARPSAAMLELSVERVGEGYSATLRSAAASPLRLAAYWTVTENDHTTQVTAGENAGALLHHDFVVRDYRKVAPWEMAPGASVSFSFEPALRGKAERAREVALVVVDVATARPVQALRLSGC